MDELLAALEAATLARELRNSVWVYPLVNSGHILGIALLVGAVVPFDLRLLGVWRGVRLVPLWRVLSSMASIGMAIAIAFGVPLFIVRATEYAQSDLFLGKMIVFVIGCINALALRRAAARSAWLDADTPAPTSARIAAVVSLVAWMAVLVLGRLVGYF